MTAGMVFYRVLELAAGHEPVRYRNITAGNKPRKTSPGAACYARVSAEPGSSHRRASVARCVSAILRLNGEPEIGLCRLPDYAGRGVKVLVRVLCSGVGAG